LRRPVVLVEWCSCFDGDMYESCNENGPSMNEVHVRIGSYRDSYHTDTDCPALNSKPETFMGIERMSRKDAEVQGLKHCQRCKE
jgi:hypothetical protein